ncbi:MAG: tyrosine-type recombinase/integrase, partial [Mycobacteriaceae bacterium]|nr:tyrosine-type recombinase/integrase [Mycobacteriaceae bacterium]
MLLNGCFSRHPGNCPRSKEAHGGRCSGPDPHGLRHTTASLAVSEGANVKSVQRMLSHASAATTVNVYADLFNEVA